MNNSAKFQLYTPYSFWGDDFLIFFRKFILLIAIVINEIERFGQKWYAIATKVLEQWQ